MPVAEGVWVGDNLDFMNFLCIVGKHAWEFLKRGSSLSNVREAREQKSLKGGEAFRDIPHY